MRPISFRCVVVALALSGPALVDADSRQAPLQVTVVVTRQCTVTTGPTAEVACTRAPGAVIQASADGRMAQPTPLVSTGPGLTSASLPIAPGTSTITIQF